jgi:galactokinase
MLKVYAPGRAELLGNHTDYNEGFVLSLAVNRGITLTGEARNDNRIILHDVSYMKTSYETTLDAIRPLKEPNWPNYILGVVAQYLKAGHKLGGFEFSITSDLPVGAGLSSSAALEISTALFLQKAFNISVDPLTTTKFAQAAEHQYAGVKCGLLDQISSLMSRENCATYIDCRTYEVKNIPLPAGACFIVANSGAKHALVGGEYNERRSDCEAAAHALGVPFLRDVTSSSLDAGRSKMSDRQYHRARHVVGENERVLAALEALKAGQLADFGKLMFASHESSIHNFENSCVELDALVASAKKFPGAYGARLSGGGFGGATINLVDPKQADAFIKHLGSLASECLVTPAAPGAHVL